MEKGQIVAVETYDHKLVECRLVDVRQRTAIVCSEQEWQRAQAERRKPECLGWPLASVRETKQRASPPHER